MNVDDLKLGEVKQLINLFGSKSDDSHWQIGKNYFVKTVTHYFTGNLIKVTDKELVLKNVAWIADTGRYTQALEQGKFDEVELYPEGSEVIIGRGALIDAFQITKDLPKKQE